MSRPTTELAHLFRQLKAPAAARALPKLADRARQEEWSYEQFAAALLKTETDSRDSHGGQARIKTARFPARKTLEEFDFAFQTSLKRDTVLHLGQLDFLHGKENIVLLGPPGTGKTHLSIALGIRACRAGHRVVFRTATEWVALLADAQRHGRLDQELDRLQRIPLLIVDEVGYTPFDPQAANLMFMLVSRRYERASLIVTSNKPFSAWGEIFGDDVTAAAMIDRSFTTPRSWRSKATPTASKTATCTAQRRPKTDPLPGGQALAGAAPPRPSGPRLRSPGDAAHWRAFQFPMPDSSGPVFTRRNRTTFQPALTGSVAGVVVPAVVRVVRTDPCCPYRPRREAGPAAHWNSRFGPRLVGLEQDIELCTRLRSACGSICPTGRALNTCRTSKQPGGEAVSVVIQRCADTRLFLRR